MLVRMNVPNINSGLFLNILTKVLISYSVCLPSYLYDIISCTSYVHVLSVSLHRKQSKEYDSPNKSSNICVVNIFGYFHLISLQPKSIGLLYCFGLPFIALKATGNECIVLANKFFDFEQA